MNRWVWFLLCAILGLIMLGMGLLIPVHLRAVDARVVERAGRKTTALTEEGLRFAGEKKLGAAQLLLKAAEDEGIPNRERLREAVTNLAGTHPGFLIWGGSEPHLEILFETESRKPRPIPEPPPVMRMVFPESFITTYPRVDGDIIVRCARAMLTCDLAPSPKYYVRPYSLVKRLYPTLAGRAMLIINKDSCIV